MRASRLLPFSAMAVLWLGACGGGAPATLSFVDVSPAQPKLGEITTLRFRAVDERGAPQPGVKVHFRLQSEVPGVTLDPAESLTNTDEGVASVQVTATARVSSVVVVAEAGGKTATSPPITFAGSLPNAEQFTFQCGPLSGEASGGVHAIGAYDASRYLIAGVKLRCYAHVGDRNGDGLAGVLVSFLTEAGTIGPTETSVTDVVGNANVLYKSSLPLPKDVEPSRFSWEPAKDATHTGELLAPLWMHPWEWKANPVAGQASPPTLDEPRRPDPIIPGRINNPRDNLVAMIAVTTGEESFEDNNNNGQFDEGEPFVDLTEPFVDSNDNGTWDADERYVDANGDGEWTGKNGQWDGSAPIWVQERILWTGVPARADLSGTHPTVAVVDPPGGDGFEILHQRSVAITVLLSDPWFNTMAANGDTDGCTVDSGEPPLVNTIPQKFSGRLLTYPSPSRLNFMIRDAHSTEGETPDPPFPSPLPLSLALQCQYTAASEQGHIVYLPAVYLHGTVL